MGFLDKFLGREKTPSTATGKNVIAARDATRHQTARSLSIEEQRRLRPQFRYEHKDTPTLSFKEFHALFGPAIENTIDAMMKIYGEHGHMGAPIAVQLIPQSGTEIFYKAAVNRSQYVDIVMDPLGGTPKIQSGYMEPFRYFGVWEAPWSKGPVREMTAHEFGHALVGAAAPLHHGFQEAFAELNRFILMEKCPELRLSGAGGEYDWRSNTPEVLAGSTGWGTPEYTNVHIATCTAIDAQYGASLASLMHGLDGSLDNGVVLIRNMLLDWREKHRVPDADAIHGHLKVPTIEEWLKKADTWVPGFAERYRSKGMFQPESLMQQGERIVWQPHTNEWGGTVSVLQCDVNPSLFRTVKDLQYSPKPLRLGTGKDIDDRYCTLDNRPFKISMTFPGHSIDFMSKRIEECENVTPNLVAGVAKHAGIVLVPGQRIHLYIQSESPAGVHALKVLEWNEQSEQSLREQTTTGVPPS